MPYIFSFLCILLILTGCEDNPSDQSLQDKNRDTANQIITQTHGCKKCHPMQLDEHHQLSCSYCHMGNEKSDNKDGGHQGLISQPAHPDHMVKSCGECHEKWVTDIKHSQHMTLSNSINMVRMALGASDKLNNLTEIPVVPQPENLVGLGDDLLRRRCLRCHLYNKGDNYPAVKHATGCGSCHLNFSKNEFSHTFLRKPSDKQCLHCHYGNRVGFDYHGRFEHDLGQEFRTPFDGNKTRIKPYGIEYHDLTPDIHFTKGMICIDCHSGKSLMSIQSEPNRISCRSCHDKKVLDQRKVTGVIKQDGVFLFNSHNNKLHKIPFMTDPAHNRDSEQLDCQVCHALWSFNDQGIHLLRSDLDEYDQFHHLIQQGSSEVFDILTTSLDFYKEDPEPVMSDKISGEERLGLWYMGYGSRRWESVILGRDKNNRIRVMRPILDLHLSWIDEDEVVRFDSVSSSPTRQNSGLVPYTPHTTGKAGLFYGHRLQRFLLREKINNMENKSSEPEKMRTIQ